MPVEMKPKQRARPKLCLKLRAPGTKRRILALRQEEEEEIVWRDPWIKREEKLGGEMGRVIEEHVSSRTVR
jgi:hypothetical protein